MSKKDRQLVFDKYGGRCAYCGCELVKGWHIDHLEPIRRKWKLEYLSNGLCTGRKLPDGCDNPEMECMENYMPSCASCNINKHSMGLEDFRNLIAGFMKHLNQINTQYKIAKRYGLVTENIKPIVFYFETKSEIENL